MNWEESVSLIRSNSAYAQLVKDSYFTSDLVFNVESFRKSEEFKETLKLILANVNKSKISILDIGAGNGIASISFALEGFQVFALEPDSSNSVGAGAIEILKSKFQLTNLEIFNSFGENMPFLSETFDVVYCRQTMHHASNLKKFANDIYRVLKNNGILLTTRDHVVNNNYEKKRFLSNHPLHKYYGGENAFSLKDYKNALLESGFNILEIYGPNDTVINYSPWNKDRLRNKLIKYSPFLIISDSIFNFLWKLFLIRLRFVPGRLYSILAKK